MNCCAKRPPPVEHSHFLIRDFAAGDEAALRRVFLSAVRDGTRDFYTPAQRNAWALTYCDPNDWARRVSTLRPYVALDGADVVGYADLQADGLIDHFFVATPFARHGVGAALMAHIEAAARHQRIRALHAFVSLAAERFFCRHGFAVVQRQSVVVASGVALCNARMVKRIAAVADGAAP